jgi:hypothetical protein
LELDRKGLLEGGQGGLAGQVAIVRGAVAEGLEGSVGAQGVAVVLVTVAGRDAVDAGPDDSREGGLGQVRGAGVVEGLDKSLVRPRCLPNGRVGCQPGIAGEGTVDGSKRGGVLALLHGP